MALIDRKIILSSSVAVGGGFAPPPLNPPTGAPPLGPGVTDPSRASDHAAGRCEPQKTQ